MGIDIRNGAQLECIHCALCIDACDQMMDKIGRPRGLIAYDTDAAMDAVAHGQKPKYQLLRARTILYAVLMAFIAGLMTFGLSTRASFEINTLTDGSLRNGYTLKLVNKTGDDREMRIEASGLAGAELDIIGLEAEGEPDVFLLPVAANGVDRFKLYITVPPGTVARQDHITFTVTDTDTGETHTNTVSFRGQ